MNETQRTFVRTHGILVGRILIGLLFFVSGLSMLFGEIGISGVAGMIEKIGFPVPGLIAWVVILIKIVAGAGLMLGFCVEKSAIALFTFTLLTVIFVHNTAEDLTQALKNLSIMGGLLYVVAYGTGDSWRISSK